MRKIPAFFFSAVTGLVMFLLTSAAAFSQYTITGEISDAANLKPLAFVNILEGKTNGTTTNIDGRFRISVPSLPATLAFSYVGYEKQTVLVTAAEHTDLRFLLSANGVGLTEVTILPGVNPADAIIRRVSEKRDTLDPQKLQSFSYNTYNKVVFTSQQDTSKGELRENIFGGTDSSEIQAREFFSRQHLFINESVTERKFLAPDHSSEMIIASRTSGMKNPIFSSLTTQLQSLSFYDEYFSILNFKYLNPLSRNSTDYYYFNIEDTTFSNGDTVLIISYRPRKGKKFEALKGVLAVNKTHYALETATAQPFQGDQSAIRIQHKYERVDSIHWFPVQQNTDIFLDNFAIGSVKLVVEGRTYIRDIKVNPPLKKREFDALAVDIDPRATDNADKIFPLFRENDLSAKDSLTYHVIDSVGKVFKIDRRINSLEALLNGKLRIKWVDIDLTRIFTYNNYESVRLGAGLNTNERLVRWFNFGGYFAYGFGDQAFKYGGYVEFIPHRRTDTRIRLEYRQDLIESGNSDYPIAPPFTLENIYRSYVLNVFDSIQSVEGSIRFKPVANVLLRFSAAHQIVNPTTAYRFLPDGTENPQYRFTELSLSMRWGIKEKYISLGSNVISLGTRYPVIWVNITQSLPRLGGPFYYTRLIAKVEQSFDLRRLGKSRFILSGGYIFNDAPYTKLYGERGSFAAFSFVSRGAFETMRANEFVSNAFVSLYFSHNFGTLFKVKRFMRPELSIVHNLGFGWLDNAKRHSGVAFKTMEHGFFEGGIVIDKIIVISNIGLGGGVFHRYGAYANPDPLRNFYFKAALSLGF